MTKQISKRIHRGFRGVFLCIVSSLLALYSHSVHALSAMFYDANGIYATVLNNVVSPLPSGITHPDLLPVDPAVPENRFTVDPNNTEVISFSFSHPDYYIFGNIANFTEGAYYGIMVSDFGLISKTANEVSGSILMQDLMTFPPPDSSRPGRAGFIGETLLGRFIYPDFFGDCLQVQTCYAHIFTTALGGTNVNFGLDTSILTNPFNARESGVLPSNFDPPSRISGAGMSAVFNFSVKGVGTTIVVNTAQYFLDDSALTFDSRSPQWGSISPWENGTLGVNGEDDFLWPQGAGKAPWLGAPPWGAEGLAPWEGGKNDPNPWGFASNAPEPSTMALLGASFAAGLFVPRRRVRHVVRGERRA